MVRSICRHAEWCGHSLHTINSRKDLLYLLLFIILAINPMVMKMDSALTIFTAFFLIFFSLGVYGQVADRQPVVAGQFYPGEASALKTDLQQYFQDCSDEERKGELAAIIAPHAGYKYSGRVAASAYHQIDPQKNYDNIFILAPSHHVRFEGASLYAQGDYLTPLGKVEVNRKLVQKLTGQHKFFKYHGPAHEKEHSLEVQLPFLQHHLQEDFQIVPIVTGTHDLQVIRQMARALQPYFNGRNLFVVSTDFSHYPPYDDAVEVDAATAEAVGTNSPSELLQVLRANADKDISRLATSMCGWPGMLTLLNMSSKESSAIEVRKLLYRNSGDITGDHSRVVGYWAMSMIRKKHHTKNKHMDFQLSQEEKHTLLKIARQTVNSYVRDNRIPEVDEKELTENLQVHIGAFVTLSMQGELRGCIGRFGAEMPLYEVVRNMAVAACSEDARFPPVKEEELKDIAIEVSVLTPLKEIASPADIELGRDGIYIRKGPHTGTLLPQVAEKTGWSKEEFLGHCARDKAGIGWNGWKDENAELYAYQAIIFKEGAQEQNTH